MEQAHKFIDERNYSDAFEIVNDEVRKAPKDVELLLLRSTLYLRLGKAKEALEDAEKAVVLSQGSGMSQLRRAISLWRLDRKGEGKSLVKYFEKSPESDTWAKLFNDDTSPVVELPKIPTTAQNEPKKPLAQPDTAPVSGSTPNAEQKVPEIKTDWYQSSDKVTLVVYRKGLKEEQTAISIKPTQLSIESEGFNWNLGLGNEVDAEASTYELSAFKVEFVLKKKFPVPWTSLSEASSSQAVKPDPTPAPKAKLSYAKWEKLDDEDAESNDPMAFFQSIYKDASPEVQRAMMKSYVESNGTALSTNWSEVSKGKVETHPPKDMEAKKW